MEQIPTTLRIDEDIHKVLRNIAFKERRSINNLINYILRQYIEEKEKSSK